MIKGSIVAIVTPMTKSGDIDKKSFANLLEMHINSGTDAIVVNGTTGESATLSPDESIDLIKYSLDVVNKKIPIIAGTGTNSTKLTIEKTQAVYKLGGVHSALIVAPYYNRPTQEGIFLHYKNIAESVDLPVLLYNVPTRTSCDILPETVLRLSSIKNIIGVKEATGDLSRLEFFKKNCDSNFALYSGDDATCLDFMLQGGDGVISVTSNVAPNLMANMCDFALTSKDVDKAKEIDHTLENLHKYLMVEPNPIPVKWSLNYLGLINEGIRLPLTWLTKDSQEKLQVILDKIDLR